jgi:hypothetical protein
MLQIVSSLMVYLKSRPNDRDITETLETEVSQATNCDTERNLKTKELNIFAGTEDTQKNNLKNNHEGATT